MRKAFTLIEILIVIAIIGILAVAVLIALDPVEQVARANDVKFVTAAGEIRGATYRYFASKGYFPWCTSASSTGTGCGTYRAPCITGGVIGSFNDSVNSTCAEAVLAELVASGDLKSGISVDAKLSLDKETGDETFQIYYVPNSKSEKVKYTSIVGSNGIYVTPSGNTACTTLGTATQGNTYCPSTTGSTCTFCVF